MKIGTIDGSFPRYFVSRPLGVVFSLARYGIVETRRKSIKNEFRYA